MVGMYFHALAHALSAMAIINCWLDLICAEFRRPLVPPRGERYTAEEIASAFGVPSSVLGTPDAGSPFLEDHP